MSFYTSLTGLNAATAMLGVTSNNIANVGTTGFKRSRADFGDIFATSPLQKASSTVGQGVSLKQVSQEFSQGNISFSSNALDLAITGDGFFPMRSADGLQETYTRNGSFLLNEQYNVVNSAGQRLMAATVDSTGSANVNDRVVLTIPQKTSGEAKQTSLVSLGLNFPADAAVINVPFNRTDPASYNKSTAFTVYDNGGNGYLATIYYAKTQNANQNSPFNKWQTYVYVGEDQVSAALAQSTDLTGDLQYVNQYGQIKSYKEVKDELTTAKTQLISLDELTDKRTSSPAAISGIPSQVDLSGGTNTFASIVKTSQMDLSKLFTVNVDGSTQPVVVDLSYLKDSKKILNGVAVAAEATKYLNRKFGDETSFNFTSTIPSRLNPDTNLSLTNSRIGSEIKVPITLSGFQDPSNVGIEELQQIFQTQVDNSVLGGHARQRIDLSGNVPNPVAPSTITAAKFLGYQLPNTSGQTAGDTALQTAQKIVDKTNKAAILALPDVIARGISDITLGADGQSVVLEYNQFPKTFHKIAGTMGAGTAASKFQGVELVGSAPGDSAAKTALLIIANKKAILASTTPATSLSLRGVKDIQLDPNDVEGTTLVFVYDQTKKGAPALPANGLGTPVALGIPLTFSGHELTGETNGVAAITLSWVAGATSGPGPADAIINKKFEGGQGTPELLTDIVSGGIVAGTPLLLNPNLASSPMTVVYDYNTQSFKVTDSTNAGANTITMGAGVDTSGAFLANNGILNLTGSPKTLDGNGLSGVKMLPNNKNPLRSASDQRYGMTVSYDAVSKTFSVKSGTTGDYSSISITDVSADGLKLMGLKKSEIAKSPVALRGISSLPAVAVGKPPTVNVTNNFNVDETNNSFVVTVDGIKGTVRIPPSSTYSLESFMRELQRGINNLAGDEPDPNDPKLSSPATVNGTKVTFDYTNNRFVFTSGTTGSDSFIKISGDTAWGLDQVEAGRGATSTWIKPSQHYDIVGGAPQAKFIDKDGKETTNGDGFAGLPAWSPIYLDKGELTFNTAGKLFSPIQGTQLETVYLAGGKGALTINVNYAASTQYTSAFAVLSQSQDGAPEGSLVGVTIGNDGLVSASFSNGTQKSLAKILLTNFSSPSGLRQIGDSSFLASAASGKPILGAAGSAGFGTLRAGATERANVDLTQELVDLITAQRNFQANAKAIETSSTMTSAIINLRS